MEDDAILEIARAILETLPEELSDEDKKQIAAEIAVMVSEVEEDDVNNNRAAQKTEKTV